MPHSTRRKKRIEHSKRQEIADDDGWTRVVKTTPSNRHSLTSDDRHGRHDHDKSSNTQQPPLHLNLTPTQVPSDATLSSLQHRFTRLQSQWRASPSYAALATALKRQETSSITTHLLLGSGTFCGYRSGWIGRHDVALLQVAVFVSILDLSTGKEGKGGPKAYAQEPLYNELDKEFLGTLGVEVLVDPKGFEVVEERTFVYAPGAEREIVRRVLKGKPECVLGSDLRLYLDDSSREGVEAEDAAAATGRMFMGEHDSVRLPDFDMANEPFREQYLYYPKPKEEEEGGVDGNDGMTTS